MSDWRWFEHRADLYGPELNMRIDQALLESFVAGEALQTVRVYNWPSRYVTVGRLQNVAEVAAAYPHDKLLVRPTGGRAVVHGDDITVTVVANEAEIKSLTNDTGVLSTYRVILEGVVDTLAEFGVHPATGYQRGSKLPVDCFSSTSKCDVVNAVTEEKIVGSAQRRVRGAIIQQMSIRTGSRYHIHETNDFVSALRGHLSVRLSVNSWRIADELTASEMARITQFQ